MCGEPTDEVQSAGTRSTATSVIHSGRDILFGDPTAGSGCVGNTVRNGHSLDVEDNFTDVEFVVRGNMFEGGDLRVEDNSGASDKFVQNNTGGDELECFDNETPFTGTPNGFTTEEGQCAEI